MWSRLCPQPAVCFWTSHFAPSIAPCVKWGNLIKLSLGPLLLWQLNVILQMKILGTQMAIPIHCTKQRFTLKSKEEGLRGNLTVFLERKITSRNYFLKGRRGQQRQIFIYTVSLKARTIIVIYFPARRILAPGMLLVRKSRAFLSLVFYRLWCVNPSTSRVLQKLFRRPGGSSPTCHSDLSGSVSFALPLVLLPKDFHVLGLWSLIFSHISDVLAQEAKGL